MKSGMFRSWLDYALFFVFGLLICALIWLVVRGIL